MSFPIPDNKSTNQPPPTVSAKQRGSDGARTFEKTNRDVSKHVTQVALCISAFLIGAALIALVGGFGFAGILQNHGFAHLPNWLVTQINTVANPYLYVMTLAGSIGGCLIICAGGYFLHDALLKKGLQDYSNLSTAPITQNAPKLIKNEKKERSTVEVNSQEEPLMAGSSSESVIPDKEFLEQIFMTYDEEEHGKGDDLIYLMGELKENRTYIYNDPASASEVSCYIIMKNGAGTIKIAKEINEQQQRRAITLLENNWGYDWPKDFDAEAFLPRKDSKASNAKFNSVSKKK